MNLNPNKLEFGLFYFSTGEAESAAERYRLVLEGARFADAHGLASVWLPERHFGAVGSLYPNPSVLHAALARETRQVGLRAGSVVLPLHDPLRVAEEWSLVDNLSGGRTGIAFASGWHPRDFVLAPENYADRQEVMYRNIEIVRRLWRGGTVQRRGGDGKDVELRIYPRPVQPELPFWITAAGNPKTFERAGQVGANLLTHMFNQSIEETRAKIDIYRSALAASGFDRRSRRVTMMLHAFVGRDAKMVDDAVRRPFTEYLRSSADVLGGIAASKGHKIDFSKLTPEDREGLLNFVYERLLDGRVLFGTPDSVFDFVRQVREIGVDEIACQLDFGAPTDAVLASLPYLVELKERVERAFGAGATAGSTNGATRHDTMRPPSLPPPASASLASLRPPSVPSFQPTAAARPDAARPGAPARSPSMRPEAMRPEASRAPRTMPPPSARSASMRPMSLFPPMEELDVIRARCSAVLDPDRFYATLAEGGIDYTPDVRRIRWLGRCDGESLAELSCDRAELEGGALLDAGFQALFAALPGDVGGAPFVPAGIDAFEVTATEWPEVAFGHARCRPSGANAMVGAVRVLDAAGQELARLKGVRLKRVAVPAPPPPKSAANFLHGLEWRAVPPPDHGREPSARTFILTIDADDEAAHELARALGEQATVIVVEVPRGELAFSARLADAERRAGPGAWHVHAFLAASTSEAAASVAAQRALSIALALTQTIAGGTSTADRESGRLLFVTRGAQKVTASDSPGPAAAALAGFARVVGSEYPDRWEGVIDLDPRGSLADAARDLLERARPHGEDRETETAIRDRQTFALRLVPQELTERTLTAQPDASYVISGGLGGIGLTVARRLVERGARHLVLFGRTAEASPTEEPDLAELKASGVRIMIQAADVTSESEVDAVAARMRDEAWPPVRGVVHCAGVWEDKTIGQLDPPAIERVLAPKARGAANLRRAFAAAPLDFFVMSSSGAAWLAPPAQSNYAAANAFLDAVALRLRSEGVNAMTIDWCPWSGVGNAARQGQIDSLARRGIGHLTPAEGAAAFEAAVGHGVAQLVFVPFDWPVWGRAHPDAARAPILRELGPSVAAAMAATTFTITRGDLEKLGADARRERIGDEIARLLGGVLKMDAAKVPRDAPMPTLGLDSLMAVELKNVVEAAFGLSLPIVVLLEGPSIEALTRRLAAQLGRDEASGPTSVRVPTWPRFDRSQELVLSFAQQRLWFLANLESTSAAYNIPVAARLRGRLRADLMRQALGDVIRRHESMRTTFRTEGGQPVLRIAEPFEGELPVIAIEGVTEQERAFAAMKRATEIARVPFELHELPLWRAAILELDGDDHLLVFVMHHIVSDGWSVGLVLEDLSKAYAARTHGRPLEEPNRFQYIDYAAWQRAALVGDALDRELAYWRTTLAGAPDVLDLATDHPRPALQTFDGDFVTKDADLELANKVRSFAAREGVTPFVTLLAAFYAVLHRYTGQTDIVVGTPTANRERPESRDIVGFFAQTLALRARFAERASFRDLLGHVREAVLGAFAHPNVPFERLVDALKPPRNLGASPIFQVMFLQNTPIPPVEVPGATIELIPLHSGGAQFDLTIAVTDTVDGTILQIIYNTSLFERATAERMLGHFLRLLDDALERPEVAITELELLPPEERSRLAVDWNDTELAFPAAEGSTIRDLLEQQFRTTPTAVAVELDEVRLTYADVDARTSQLAHRLRAEGIGPESIVALLFERSLEMVIAIVAVLRAGAAYLPIAPDNPPARIGFMLEDSQASLVLTSTSLARDAALGGARAIPVDLAAWGFGDQPTSSPDVVLRADLAAYCIYTSGSTGRPKATLNTHAGLVNRLLWMQQTFALDGHDAVLQKTPFTFDVSVWEFLWPLIVGARLVVCRPLGHRDPRYLAETIQRRGVTTMHFVPSMLQAFLDEPAAAACTSLRRVIASGEALSPAHAERFFDVLPGTSLHNLYGPTEAGIDVSHFECPKDGGGPSVPIGVPIANCQLFVLDRELNLCPVGVPGELYIGGVQLARGYLRRFDLVADRFVPNPFGPAGTRLYRTGDVCRVLPDGNIDYLGRTDFQVKIRGFRIELGEIELALLGVSGVRQAVVVSRDDGRGAELVAYVSLMPGARIAADAIRSGIQQTLAPHMIPAHFVFLPDVPLNANGKVDRAALPAPEVKGSGGAEPTPEDPLTRTLCEIAAELFKVASVGVHDNFFDLGANSLLAVQFVARARERLGVEVALADLFSTPDVASLGALIASRTANPSTAEPALRRLRRRPKS